MSKFTPGPWRRMDESDQVVIYPSAEHIKRQGLVATVSVGYMRPDGLANATLISAAPDLLAALTALLAWADSDEVEIPLAHRHPLDCGCGEIIEGARAAIARATGEN